MKFKATKSLKAQKKFTQRYSIIRYKIWILIQSYGSFQQMALTC